MPKLSVVAPVLRVTDLDRSLAWYRDQLGFAVEFVYQGFYAAIVRDGCVIHLKCATPTVRDQAAFEAARHLDVYLGVTDLDGLAHSFEQRHVPFLLPPTDAGYGREFYVRDPDGYVLGFVEPAADKFG